LSNNADVCSEFLSHIAMSPAPAKTTGPDGIGVGVGVGPGPGVGPIGDELPQYPQARHTASTRTGRRAS